MSEHGNKGWRVVRDLKADWQEWTQVERMAAAVIAMAILVVPFFLMTHH